MRVTQDAGRRAHRLFHGSTLHGQQSLDPVLSREPSTYFTRSGPIGQALQLQLPEPYAVAIGAPAIGADQQSGCLRIGRLPHPLPPATDTLHRELCCLMIDADIHEALILDQIIDPLRDGFAIG